MCQETFYDTSKQVRRLSFGVLTVLTNIISTKVIWLMEDNLWWRMTFGERRPSVEDDLWWKTTFGGRKLLLEDNLQWRMTFSGRRPLVEDDLRWILACSLVDFAAFLK